MTKIETKFARAYDVKMSVVPSESSLSRALRELDNYNNAVFQQAVRTPDDIMREQRKLDPRDYLGKTLDVLA